MAAKRPVRRRVENRKKKSFLRDFLEVVIPAVLIFLVVRAFLFEARWVPSPSMVPTIEEQDRFLENKIVYRFRQPKRGEIVVFHPPEAAVAGTSLDEDFVKRVIGLPGDRISIRAGRVYLTKRGEKKETLLDEPYVPVDGMDYKSFPGPGSPKPYYEVPEGHLFVMGDNRLRSNDSRYWGYLPIRNVDGKAFWRFWPLGRISLLR
ncbi:MAG: signal peptidase I [Patescibacteria group bacterium]